MKNMEQFAKTLSQERLLSFKQNIDDTLEILIERYKNNIRISQALYPELSVLEITLRNAINFTLCKFISKTWIEDEIKQRKILSEYDHKTLCAVYSEIKSNYSNNFTIGKVIAKLNFGFWTNLCSKWYCSNIWNKGCCFKGIFVNYPHNVNQIGLISNKLRAIRTLRNRIFHYEPILKNPQRLLAKYNDIMEMLSYLPKDDTNILKETTIFLNTFNEIMKSSNKTKT